MQYHELKKLMKGRQDHLRLNKYRMFAIDVLMQISGGLGNGYISVIIWYAAVQLANGANPKSLICWREMMNRPRHDKNDPIIQNRRIALVYAKKVLRQLAFEETMN